MRLPGSEKVIVGYDLGNKYAQISCYVTGSEEEIRTLSSVAGSSVYTIPLALSKRQGVNQWFYGRKRSNTICRGGRRNSGGEPFEAGQGRRTGADRRRTD